jgi:hypothetical protein
MIALSAPNLILIAVPCLVIGTLYALIFYLAHRCRRRTLDALSFARDVLEADRRAGTTQSDPGHADGHLTCDRCSIHDDP